MFIGLLQFELRIADARSLKDKRRVVRSLKDRLHRSHQVSVAEVGLHETAERALLGVALAAPSAPRAAAVLDTVISKLHALTDAELLGLHREVVRFDALLDIARDGDTAPVFDAAERAAAEALLTPDSAESLP